MNETQELTQKLLLGAQEAAQDLYGEMVDVLVEHDLLTQDAEYNHTLVTRMTPETWGSDAPSPDTQFVVVQEFFERLSELGTADAMACIATLLKHADAANYVESLEAEEAEKADDDLSKL